MRYAYIPVCLALPIYWIHIVYSHQRSRTNAPDGACDITGLQDNSFLTVCSQIWHPISRAVGAQEGEGEQQQTTVELCAVTVALFVVHPQFRPVSHALIAVLQLTYLIPPTCPVWIWIQPLCEVLWVQGEGTVALV